MKVLSVISVNLNRGFPELRSTSFQNTLIRSGAFKNSFSKLRVFESLSGLEDGANFSLWSVTVELECAFRDP